MNETGGWRALVEDWTLPPSSGWRRTPVWTPSRGSACPPGWLGRRIGGLRACGGGLRKHKFVRSDVTSLFTLSLLSISLTLNLSLSSHYTFSFLSHSHILFSISFTNSSLSSLSIPLFSTRVVFHSGVNKTYRVIFTCSILLFTD